MQTINLMLCLRYLKSVVIIVIIIKIDYYEVCVKVNLT